MRTNRTIQTDKLRNLPLFGGCSDKDLEHVARLTTATSLPAGAVLCREGYTGQEAFIVIDGEASVTIDGEVVGSVGRGDVIGEMAVLENEPRVATVTAVTPLEVYVLSAREFLSLVSLVPSVARRMMATLSGRLRSVEAAAS
jgi:CRP-like cAMP-binding protein